MKSNPKAFDNYILPVSHSHQTRANQSGHYQAFKPKTEKGKTLICYRGVTVWNSYPSTVRDFNRSFNDFKLHLKEYLLSITQTAH